MSLSVKFNGTELNEYLTVLSGYTSLAGADWNPSVRERDGSLAGAEFQSTRYGAKTISMPFAISHNINSSYDRLQDILNVNEPKELIFGDAPDRYFLAIPEGTLDMEQYRKKGKGIITWLIPDGAAHSLTEREYHASVGEDGILSLMIVNNGTESVPVDYTITHNHENGYLGIVSQHGSIQLGKVEEVDGITYRQNEKLASLASFQRLPDDSGTNYMHPAHCMSGSLAYEMIGGRACLRLKSMGAGTSGKWCGGMRTLELPEDSEGNKGAKDFYCYLNHWFETGANGQTSEQTTAFLTEDNREICGYSLYKGDLSGNMGVYEMRANGKILKFVHFMPSNRDADNPFNQGRGHSDIYKSGDKVRFYWWGSYLQFTVPEIKDMACTKIQVAFTQYYDRGLGNRYVTRNYLRSIDFSKCNVEKWKDIPNRYASGDVVHIDGSSTKVYVNGMERQRDEIRGSQYFLAPPGETEIQFFCSSFSNPLPDVTARIREAYI